MVPNTSTLVKSFEVVFPRIGASKCLSGYETLVLFLFLVYYLLENV